MTVLTTRDGMKLHLQRWPLDGSAHGMVQIVHGLGEHIGRYERLAREREILATLEQLTRPREDQSRNLRSIVDRVRPSVEALLATELRHDPDALVRHAVRANIRASANHLRHGSEVLEQLIQNNGLLIVGAEYSLETGLVDFFDGASDAA